MQCMGNAINYILYAVQPCPVRQKSRSEHQILIPLSGGSGHETNFTHLIPRRHFHCTSISTASDCYTIRFSPTSVGWYVQWAHCLSAGLSDQTSTLSEAGNFCNGLVNSLCLKQITTCLKWKVFCWFGLVYFRVSHSWGERWQCVDNCCTQWQSSRISWTH